MNRKGGPQSRTCSGATLIEVLVAVAVTSFGLLGMAGLLTVAVKVNHESYVSTQANLAAESFIESLRINRTAVAHGDYDGPVVEKAYPNCDQRACDSANRASFDKGRFADDLARSLPNPVAGAECKRETAVANSPVVQDTCRIEISWSDPGTVSTIGARKSLVWVVLL